MTSAATNWAEALASWAIPEEILNQAPESPWIHPPALFEVPDTIESTPSHERAREAMPAGGSVLDIGCGGGIAAFALAPDASHVIGVDQQSEMLVMFNERARMLGVTSETHLGFWPAIEAETAVADVVTCHHVVYNVSDIEPFLRALNEHARRRVVIELPQRHPLWNSRYAWRHFWNIDRPMDPTPEMLMDALSEMGIAANLELWDGKPVRQLPQEMEVEFTRIRLCLDSSRDTDIREFLQNEPPSTVRPLATIWWNK